ncbi:MAG: alpha/beta fold hydrolase [Nitriliruptorales bacterium]
MGLIKWPLRDEERSRRRVETFSYRGHQLAFEVHGEGPRVLVYTHGLLLDSGMNRALAQALAAHGHRVVLLDLLGHGASDRPRHATEHRMDSYADQVIALLDHLEVDQAVVGGVSLGANVGLHAAVLAPERVRALLVEMPVLEWATPAAGLVVIPMLLVVRFLRPLAALAAAGAQRLPRTGFGPIDSFLDSASMDPREMAAVLHGLLVGPSAPTLEQRRAITAPALIIGHEHDYIHPFSDASNLEEQLPNGRLVHARSVFELRTRPTHLTGEIADFLNEAWRPQATSPDTEELPAEA